MKFISIPIATLCFVFLFIGGPDYYSSRIFTQAWGLGHIIAFSFWTYLLLKFCKTISGKPFIKQCWQVLLIALFFGILTEIVQIIFNRTPLIGDVINDLKGTLITLAFIASARKTISQNILRISQVLIIIMILFDIYPLSVTVTDEAIAKIQFPVIAGFETPFETSRLSSPDYIRDSSISRKGKYSLKVPLANKKHSGVGFKHFPGNWEGYDFFKVSIYNQSSNKIMIHLKIYDFIHVNTGRKYNDRFNKSINLKQGWNDIQIPLVEIATAPANRKMDLSNIYEFGLHASHLQQQNAIYVDDVRLMN
ncbi:MAG: VanZ family protein [Bacteroidales bacterium]|nr:VanZ family protein [Bacteroidales bacterium]